MLHHSCSADSLYKSAPSTGSDTDLDFEQANEEGKYLKKFDLKNLEIWIPRNIHNSTFLLVFHIFSRLVCAIKVLALK